MEDNATMTSPPAASEWPPRPPECGNFEDVSAFRFWFDGVLVSVIAIVGFIGNLLALIVLSRERFRVSQKDLRAFLSVFYLGLK